MAESNGDKSDGENEDEGQLDGGLPFDGGLEGEGDVGSPRLRGCTTAAEQYYVGRLEEPTVGARARDCDQGASVDQDAEELALPQPQRAPPCSQCRLWLRRGSVLPTKFHQSFPAAT
jgi:hypothetical protein